MSLTWYIFLFSPHQAQHSSRDNTLLFLGASLPHPLNNKFSYPWLGYHCGVSKWFQQLHHQHDTSPFTSAEKYILTLPSSWITVLWHLQYVIFRTGPRQWIQEPNSSLLQTQNQESLIISFVLMTASWVEDTMLTLQFKSCFIPLCLSHVSFTYSHISVCIEAIYIIDHSHNFGTQVTVSSKRQELIGCAWSQEVCICYPLIPIM